MRKKEEIMQQAADSKFEFRDEGIEIEHTPSGYALAVLEVLVDIRDQMVLLNNKIPVVRPAGTPSSPPPPGVG